MDDEKIENMLLEIFKCWVYSNNIQIVNNKNDSESVLSRQETFNEAKKIVRQFLSSE